MNLSVSPIQIENIQEQDVILFLKDSILKIKNTGGADYILTIDKSSKDLKYTYNPSVLKTDNQFNRENKVFEGNLKSLSKSFSLFKVENINFFETQEYLKKSLDNLSVLPQFFDEIGEILKLKNQDLNIKIQSILSEPLSSIIFCNILNTHFDLIHEIYFHEGGYEKISQNPAYFSKLLKLKSSLEVVLGV